MLGTVITIVCDDQGFMQTTTCVSTSPNEIAHAASHAGIDGSDPAALIGKCILTFVSTAC